MKKLLLVAICILSYVGANAQEKTKKEYLPVKGDWAIGIDASPVLKYVGNIFNGNTDNGLNNLGGSPFTTNYAFFESQIMPDISISGKYLLKDNWALRANLGLLVNSISKRSYAVDDNAIKIDPTSEDKVIDKMRTSRDGMSLSLGGEYRRGTRRVQGVFGAGLLFAFQKNKTNYKWGNEMTMENKTPTSNITYSGYRPLTTFGDASTIYVGITGSAGVEWFVAPKISLGAEVNLSAYYVTQSKQYTDLQGYNTTLDKIEEKTQMISPGNRAFVFGTESLGGALNITFYF